VKEMQQQQTNKGELRIQGNTKKVKRKKEGEKIEKEN
jgi:hypothetical protein